MGRHPGSADDVVKTLLWIIFLIWFCIFILPLVLASAC